MKVLVDLVAFVSGVAIASVAMAGVVIPSGPEHRELHSVVLFTGADYAGDKVTLNIQAVQDGDWVQYIGVVSTDCDDSKKEDDTEYVKHKNGKSECLHPGDNVLEMGVFSQDVRNHQITQMVKANLEHTLFLASILKKQ